MRRRRKTAEEIASLRPVVRAAYIAGAWVSAIARTHDIDRKTVLRLIRGLQVPGQRVRIAAEDEARILRLHAEGRSERAIAAEVGLSYYRVRRVLVGY